ncbi:MAG: hypothetical protein LBQ88_03590 [Treponema sp.]|jgi:hypothetical protein|nr:hypothetical protein [Treponema sp.]
MKILQFEKPIITLTPEEWDEIKQEILKQADGCNKIQKKDIPVWIISTCILCLFAIAFCLLAKGA